jgi:hypothetical protein
MVWAMVQELVSLRAVIQDLQAMLPDWAMPTESARVRRQYQMLANSEG